MGSGTQRVIVGAVTGTGALLNVTARIGFRPRKVTVQNRTSRLMLEWHESQPDDSAYKTVAAGTRTVITADAIIPLAKGFSIGTDATNGADEILDFIAEE